MGRDFPRLVALETTNRCNARCVFCPNRRLTRRREAMSQALFEKIIEDCRQFPLEEIEPFLQGEPFMDPDFLARLEHINRRLPNTRLRICSNGYALTPDRVDALCDLQIHELWISLNTLDPDKYWRVMRLKLERTLRNLAYLTDASRRDRVARTITFRMSRREDTTLAEQDRFLDFCRAHGVGAQIRGLFNYKGDIASNLPVPSYGCAHVTRLDILSTGKVTLCWMDQNGEYAWGDANESSVLEVYRGEVSARYRAAHASGRRRRIEPCNTCNHPWPDLRTGTPLRALRDAYRCGLYFARHRPSGRKPPQRAAE